VIAAVFRTGWQNLRRDRAALMMSFVVPVVFFSIFAMVFGSQGQRDRARRVRVLVVDEDGSERSQRLVAALLAEPGLRAATAPEAKAGRTPAPYDAAAAEQAVRGGEAPLAVIIPRGFGATRLRFGPADGEDGATSSRPKIILLADSSDPVATPLFQGLLQKAAMTALPDVFADAGVDAVETMGGGLTPEQRTLIASQLGELRRLAAQPHDDDAASGDQAGADGGLGAFGFVEVETRDLLGESKKSPMIAFFAAGIGVMFLLFTASNAGGGALLDESESGTLDRILATRVSMTSLLLGKLLYLTALGILQLCIMFLWGAAVFGLELFTHLPGFAVMTVATALACSAFGLVLATLARTRAQLGAISTLIILSFSALGGSMFPRFLMPETLQKLGLATFNSWAVEGFTKVFWREEPLAALWPQVAVLLATCAVFFALARRLARRWDTV
jgi:ABC-2 type transport system permease protein